MKIKDSGNNNRAGGGGKMKYDWWGLDFFLGEEDHTLLRLHDVARDLLVDVVGMDKTDKNSLHAPSGGDSSEINKKGD